MGAYVTWFSFFLYCQKNTTFLRDKAQRVCTFAQGSARVLSELALNSIMRTGRPHLGRGDGCKDYVSGLIS